MGIQLRCRLYDAVVKPVLSYGCEFWMPLVSESSLEELERVHLNFLRRLLDVPRVSEMSLARLILRRGTSLELPQLRTKQFSPEQSS